MPTLKGIKVNLISQWECKVHPEFPHPNAEGKHSSTQSGFHQIDVDETFEVTAIEDILDKALAMNQITASVYIPSCSGARFWLRWSITEPAAEEAPWYFFKLLMNGRPITSWGTNASEKPDGHVMRGLFEPSDRWNYKNEGTVYKNMGTESRSFMFAEEGFGHSVATDGGLIEVQVFRAFGRKRKLAEPTDFRSQEAYGIIMPSGGLLDRPQDAKFYDWHLKDPKDSPYARFKFHYRSWDSLQASELIPENHLRALLSPTPSILKTLGKSQQMGFEFVANGLSDVDSNDGSDGDGSGEEADDEDNWDMSAADEQEEPSRAPASVTPWLTGVFDSPPSKSLSSDPTSSNGLQYQTAPIRSDPVKMGTSVSRSGVKKVASIGEYTEKISSRKRKALVDRPLPKIPQRSSSVRSNHSQTSSGSPRITPSLRSYADRSAPSSPEPKVCVARAMQVIHHGKAAIFEIPRKSQAKVPTAESTPPDTSFEKSIATQNLLVVPNEFTPPMRVSSAKHNPKPLADSPLTEFFSQPNIANITVRKHKRSPGLFSRLSISGSSFRTGSPFKVGPITEQAQAENETPLLSKSPSESEWMCRTPSPVKNGDARRYENMWSPSPGGVDGKRKQEGINILNSGPAPVFNGGVLHKMKTSVGSGLKGLRSGSPVFSVISGEKKNKSEETLGPKRSFNESPISSIDGGGSMGENISSDKERLRRKGMEWIDHVKNHRAFGNSMEEPQTQTGQMSYPERVDSQQRSVMEPVSVMKFPKRSDSLETPFLQGHGAEWI